MIPSRHAPGTVLLVDDDEDTRILLRWILRGRGFTVVEAENGRQALDRLTDPQSTEPCCIVTDLAMPVMSGWELLRQIEGDARWQHIPVIILTMFPESVATESMHRRLWLTKPQAPSRLANAIASEVERAAPP